MAMINAKERTEVILFVEQDSPGVVGGMVILKYNFAHMTFWVDIALIVKNLDGFQAN